MILRLLLSDYLALIVVTWSGFTTSWMLSPRSCRFGPNLFHQHRRVFGSPRDSDTDIVDVDFERVDPSGERYGARSTPVENIPPPSRVAKSNLFDWSFDADPRWKTTRIPFCRNDEYIDAKLAFMVEMDGVQYGIAVPFDDAVAIIVQEKKKGQSKLDEAKDDIEVTYVDPDKYDENEEYQELMEIMAAHVQNELGEDFMLRKTPKVLTISGDLSRITDNWEQGLLGQPTPVEDFLKTFQIGEVSMDEDISDFMAFMRQELGEEEFEKTMREEPSDSDKELMKLFEIPGLGDKKDDIAGLQALIKSMEDDLDEESGVALQAKQFEPDTEGLSLKLISFEFADRAKSYSLVKLLEPYVLVGKYCESEFETATTEDLQYGDIRFELLSPDEERLLIPKLEILCQKDLAEAGLSFSRKSDLAENR